MTNSSTLVSGSDEFLQRLASIGQVLNWEPLLANKASPQPNEAFRVAGELHSSCRVGELGLKECILPLGYRRNVKCLGYTHTAGADSTVGIPIRSSLHGGFRAWPRTCRDSSHEEIPTYNFEDQGWVWEEKTIKLSSFFIYASEEHHPLLWS